MSKMEGLRAMREAKYAAARAGAAQPAPTKPASGTAAPARPAAASTAPTAASAVEPGADPGLCGHRNMGGRTCTRELGHTAKSHRYS